MNNDSLINAFKLSITDSIKKDTSMLPKILKNIKDSLSQAYLQKADEVLGMSANLNIPVGWNSESAPLSWFHKSDQSKLMPDHSDGLLSYIWHRNNDHGWNIFKYLLGILITGFALSFGAPFWFELLVKFVNVRRSGKKPETTSSSSK